MKTIEMVDYSGGKRFVYSTVTFDGKEVKFSKDTPPIALWEFNNGVLGLRGQCFVPADGDAFMQALLLQYNRATNSFDHAELLREKKEEDGSK